jgi:DNA-binding winged helix-turn-helix (wHTH) protein/tetratricopeptide (TPR) repeat protein
VASSAPSSWSFGPFVFEATRRRLTRGGEPVELAPKAAELLLLLLEADDRVVEKHEIFDALWPDTAVQESNLTQTVYVLRKALGDAKDTEAYVQTVPRRGYRFVAHVTAPAHATADAAAPATVAPAAGAPTVEAPARAPEARWRRPAVALGVAAMVASTAWVWRDGRAVQGPGASAPSPPSAVPAARRSVAVLALRNSTARPEVAWLGTALAEMLSTELSAEPALRPIAGETVARAATALKLGDADALAPDSLARLRAVLPADLVVSGSYLVVGAGPERKLRVDVRVQEARTGETIASLAQSGSDADLLDLAALLGARVRESLGGPAGRRAEATGLPRRPDALRLYAEGLARLRRFDAAGACQRLEAAAALEPAAPLVHLALSQAQHGLGRARDARESAEQAYARAAGLSLERRLAIEAHLRAVADDWSRAADLYAVLVRQFPDDLDHVLGLAEAQTRAQQPREAMSTLARARESRAVDRADPRLDLAEAVARGALGDPVGQALAAQRGLAEARGRQSDTLQAALYVWLGWAYLRQEQPLLARDAGLKARDLYRAAGDRGGQASALNVIANHHRNVGQPLEAERLFREMLAIGRSLGDLRLTARALNNLALCLQNQGRSLDARPAFVEAIQLLREVDDARAEAMARVNLGDILAGEGRLEEARAEFENGLAVQRRTGDLQQQHYALVNLANVAREQARLDEAEALLDEAQRIARSSGNRASQVEGALLKSTLMRDRGRRPEARREVDEIRTAYQESGNRAGLLLADLMLSAILVDDGQAAEAEKLARGAWSYSRQARTTWWMCAAAEMLARALWQLGRHAEARAVWEEATRTAWRAGWRLVYSQLRADRAGAEARAGSRSAVATLDEILAEAQRNGWHRLASEVALHRAEAELDQNPAAARARLAALGEEAREKGLIEVASRAERLASEAPTARAAR